MKKKYWGLAGLVGYLLILLVLMVTDWRPHLPVTTQKPIRVVTSLNFYGEAATAVAGKYGQVTAFINSAATDPHEFQPTTAQAKELSQANVVIENGLGYDHWLSDMTKATTTQQTVVNVGQQVAGKKMGANEHVWYDPATMKQLTKHLAKVYGQLDPAHRRYYQAQARAYLKKLAQLDQTIATVKAQVKPGQQVAVSEPVFDYALTDLGYQIVDRHFEKAIEDGNDPSPADIQQLQTQIDRHELALFVNNSQASDTTVKNLVKRAKQASIPVLNVTETKPDHQTYIEWMQSQYQALRQIQEGGD